MFQQRWWHLSNSERIAIAYGWFFGPFVFWILLLFFTVRPEHTIAHFIASFFFVMMFGLMYGAVFLVLLALPYYLLLRAYDLASPLIMGVSGGPLFWVASAFVPGIDGWFRAFATASAAGAFLVFAISMHQRDKRANLYN